MTSHHFIKLIEIGYLSDDDAPIHLSLPCPTSAGGQTEKSYVRNASSAKCVHPTSVSG